MKKLSLEQTWDSQALLVGYNSFWIGCVLAEYELFEPTTFTKPCTYEFSYNFVTVLYQFLEIGTSDRCLICIVQRLRSQVLSYFILVFILTIPRFSSDTLDLLPETPRVLVETPRFHWRLSLDTKIFIGDPNEKQWGLQCKSGI